MKRLTLFALVFIMALATYPYVASLANDDDTPDSEIVEGEEGEGEGGGVNVKAIVIAIIIIVIIAIVVYWNFCEFAKLNHLWQFRHRFLKILFIFFIVKNSLSLRPNKSSILRQTQQSWQNRFYR